jgi:tripartite-type tricarboxylate transporter receptor subunit TctC
MNRYLRQVASLFIIAGAILAAQVAAAAEWPSQPIKIVLPYPPGGASDVTARLLSVKLTQAWGQPVVIENRPGANGIIANQAVAQSTPDGYTILMANLGPNAINHAVYTKLPYDTLKDFAPIILTTTVPLVIATAPNSPIKSLSQLISMAKEQPDKLSFGSAGNGASSHLAGELLLSMTGVRMLHVPYKGDAPSITDVIGGQIAVALPTTIASVPHVKSGKLRALAVTNKKRISSLPDVPTVDEALGLQNFEAVSWGGFMVPAGTPRDIILKINAEINKALAMPDIAEKLKEQGAEIVGGTPDAFNEFLSAEIVKWKQVADRAKIRLN